MTEIVAEISCNHGGSIHNAFKLIHAAQRAGADSVKFQCYNPVKIAARRDGREDVLAGAGGRSLIDIYQEAVTPREWFPELIACAEQVGLKWFSSVFDPDDVAFLEKLGCPRYKISAFEMLDWDLIKAVRETCKPLIMSVRPRKGLTVLMANNYSGEFWSLGASWHAPKRDELGGCEHPVDPDCPMVEYHLRLEGVDTLDKGFSVTEDELAEIVGWIK